MNLLIEQRPRTITSILQQQQILNHNDMHNNSSLVLKLKQHTTKQRNDLISTSSSMANEDNNSRSTTNNQRLKRTIPNTTANRPSSPAFNGKQQATKRSVTIDNNNNDLTPNIDDISATKRFKRNDLNQSSSTKVDASVETVSVGLATEPDHLGPCEPGTSVVLEGIVWNETDSGVLVVNVTWRGKTYVGTLLDSTKQDWACPRLTCESPTSDYDARNSSKTSRAKRTSTSSHNRCLNHQSVSSFQQLTSNVLSSGLDDRKLRNNIKSRQSKRTNLTLTDETTTTTNNSSPLTSPFRTNTTFFPSETPNPSSNLDQSQLISCPESQCHKRFASTIALDYHLSNSHRKTDETPSLSIQQASTRDEEDVAHILANVADYVRRPSPPSSIRCSPEHQRQTTLTWPCPQISSNLVLSSSLNNNEQTSNATRCILNNNETNLIDNSLKTSIEQDEMKSTIKPADHFLSQIQDDSHSSSSQQTLSPPSITNTSWTNTKKDRTNNNNKSRKTPTPPPPPSSSFVPIIQPPPKSSSPAYSDISDEDPTTNENEQIPPSTINLLTATNGKTDELPLIPDTQWTTQMLLQQYGSYIQQQAFVGTNTKEIPSNRLNSKNNHSSSTSPSDSTVKNILDARRLSTTKPSSPTNDSTLLLNDYQKSLYHYHTNGLTNDSKLSTSIGNSLTSPNENLLNPSTTNPLDYSLNTTCSSSLHTSR